MSLEDVKNENLVEEDVAAEELQEEELVEDENLDEESLEEANKKAEVEEDGHEEEEEEDEEEEHESKAEAIAVPKTKAGVIQAAVEILKKARKEDAQKLFSKMTKMDESEDDGSVKKAIDVVKKEGDKSIKAKAKVEQTDFDEDLDALISEEATLSDEFKGKAGAIFEAVLTSKLSQHIENLDAEYAQNLEEEVSEIQSNLVEKVDSYLNYVVENWMKENELAVTNGLRTEIAEEFMSSLQTVFKEHYIEVPEGKVDLVDDLSEQVTELEEQLNKSTDDNIKLHQSVQEFEKKEVVREQSSGLAETEAEKLASLVEDIEFDNKENFEIKVKTVKESYFTKEVNESSDEVASIVGEDSVDIDLSDTMARYTQAITKFNK